MAVGTGDYAQTPSGGGDKMDRTRYWTKGRTIDKKNDSMRQWQ